MSASIHRTRKYHNLCKYCNKEFMGNRQGMKVCYEYTCRRKLESENSRIKYEKAKAKKEAANDGA